MESKPVFMSLGTGRATDGLQLPGRFSCGADTGGAITGAADPVAAGLPPAIDHQVFAWLFAIELQ